MPCLECHQELVHTGAADWAVLSHTGCCSVRCATLKNLSLVFAIDKSALLPLFKSADEPTKLMFELEDMVKHLQSSVEQPATTTPGSPAGEYETTNQKELLMPEINIDMNPIVGAMLRVLSEPYRTFVERLHADGRITREELESLRAAILDRTERLADLTQEELRRSPGSWKVK